MKVGNRTSEEHTTMDTLRVWATIIFIVVIFIIVLAKIADSNPSDMISRQRATDGAFRDGTYLGTLSARRDEPARISFRRWATIANQESFIAGYQAAYKKILDANVQQKVLILNAQASFRDGLYLGKLTAERDRPAHVASGRWSRGDDRISFDLGYRQSYEKAIAERNRINDHRNLASK
jgi:hypothetical protein